MHSYLSAGLCLALGSPGNRATCTEGRALHAQPSPGAEMAQTTSKLLSPGLHVAVHAASTCVHSCYGPPNQPQAPPRPRAPGAGTGNTPSRQRPLRGGAWPQRGVGLSPMAVRLSAR